MSTPAASRKSASNTYQPDVVITWWLIVARSLRRVKFGLLLPPTSTLPSASEAVWNTKSRRWPFDWLLAALERSQPYVLAITAGSFRSM